MPTLLASRRRLISLVSATAIVALASTSWSSAALAAPKKKQPLPKKERVVLQVSESDAKRWNLILTTAKTLQAEYGEDKIDVAIVAIGPGVNMLKDDADVANRVQTAISRKIFFMACGSSMKTLNVDVNSLGPNVFVVPSGAAELVKRQRAGWVYLRP